MYKLLSLLAQSATPAQVDTYLSVVDKAEKSTDRWLFLATVIILALFCGLVIRYLVRDRESARTEHATQLKEAYAQAENARREHAITMKEMYGTQTKLAAELLVALQENNVLIHRMEVLLERIEKQVKT